MLGACIWELTAEISAIGQEIRPGENEQGQAASRGGALVGHLVIMV